MKISIVGLQHIHHYITLNKDKLDSENEIESFKESFDKTLIDLSINMHQAGLNPCLIANFSPHPQYMLNLSRLEKMNIEVLPDLKDDVSYHTSIKTHKETFTLKPNTKLEMANFQYKRLQESDYALTNFDTFETLSFLSEYKKDKIIVYDSLPVYRALAFVQGIVLKKAPKNFELTTKSLMQSGVSWLAILHNDVVYFITLKHRIKLDFNSVDKFLAEFLVLKDNEVIPWIEKHRIN